MAEIRNIQSVTDFIEALQRRGSYSFTRAQVRDALSMSDATLTKALQRLRRDRRVMTIRRGGFYVIVPLEYQDSGSVPVDWYIDAFMRSIDMPYYVGLLTAAQYHGAAHQRPQAFQVIVPAHVRDVQTPGVRIRFFQKKRMDLVCTQPMRTHTGDIPISTPAWTAIDLVRFSRRIGGLDAVATIVRELAERIEPHALVEAAGIEPERAHLQRLGWILDAVGFHSTADSLAGWLASHEPGKVLLDRYAPCRGAHRDHRWQVMVNTELEVDR